MTQKRVSLQISVATKNRLTQRMKYGDSLDKGISDLIDIADKYAPIAPPVPVVKEPPQEYKPEDKNEEVT